VAGQCYYGDLACDLSEPGYQNLIAAFVTDLFPNLLITYPDGSHPYIPWIGIATTTCTSYGTNLTAGTPVQATQTCVYVRYQQIPLFFVVAGNVQISCAHVSHTHVIEHVSRPHVCSDAVRFMCLAMFIVHLFLSL
jgi:hypothetical protein